MDDIVALKERLANNRLVSWESLPDLDLYMDQVVSFLTHQKPGPDSDESTITSAMINNYIKAGLLPRTKVKRYSREHLVYLTAISLLKNVLSVGEIKTLLERVLEPGSEQEFYEGFAEIVDETFTRRSETIDDEMDHSAIAETALRLAVESCASRLACQHLISILKAKGDTT